MERSCRGCPFILQLREVHTMERHILIVMELAASDKLSTTSRGPTATRRSSAASSGSSSSAQVRHSQGVAHRDLKPANLLVGGASGCRPQDCRLRPRSGVRFEQACAARGRACTRCAGRRCTWRPSSSTSPRAGYNPMAADVWSIGTVLFAMLTGRPPFHASSLAELIRMASASTLPQDAFGCEGVPRAAALAARRQPAAPRHARRRVPPPVVRAQPRRDARPRPRDRPPAPRQLDVVLGLALLPAIVGRLPLARRSSSALSSAAAGPPSPDGSPDVP